MKYWLTDRKDNIYTVKCSRVKFLDHGGLAFYKFFSLNPFLIINAGQWAVIEKVQKQKNEPTVSENVENAENQDS